MPLNLMLIPMVVVEMWSKYAGEVWIIEISWAILDDVICSRMVYEIIKATE